MAIPIIGNASKNIQGCCCPRCPVRVILNYNVRGYGQYASESPLLEFLTPDCYGEQPSGYDEIDAHYNWDTDVSITTAHQVYVPYFPGYATFVYWRIMYFLTLLTGEISVERQYTRYANFQTCSERPYCVIVCTAMYDLAVDFDYSILPWFLGGLTGKPWEYEDHPLTPEGFRHEYENSYQYRYPSRGGPLGVLAGPYPGSLLHGETTYYRRQIETCAGWPCDRCTHCRIGALLTVQSTCIEDLGLSSGQVRAMYYDEPLEPGEDCW